jgi:hypothetical protein
MPRAFATVTPNLLMLLRVPRVHPAAGSVITRQHRNGCAYRWKQHCQERQQGAIPILGSAWFDCGIRRNTVDE